MTAGGLMQGAAIGAFLGVVFDKLFVLFLHATQRAARFPSDLDRLQTTLRSIKSAVHDIESFNKNLERPPHETEALTARLIECEKLIQKCSDVSYCNPFSMWYYSKKLNDFEALLVNSFQINAAAFNARQNTSVSIEMNSLEEKICEMATMLKSSEVGRSSSNDSSERNAISSKKEKEKEKEGTETYEATEVVVVKVPCEGPGRSSRPE